VKEKKKKNKKRKNKIIKESLENIPSTSLASIQNKCKQLILVKDVRVPSETCIRDQHISQMEYSISIPLSDVQVSHVRRKPFCTDVYSRAR